MPGAPACNCRENAWIGIHGGGSTGLLVENCTGTHSGPGTVTTDMVDGSNLVQAVLDVYDGSGNLIQELTVQS